MWLPGHRPCLHLASRCRERTNNHMLSNRGLHGKATLMASAHILLATMLSCGLLTTRGAVMPQKKERTAFWTTSSVCHIDSTIYVPTGCRLPTCLAPLSLVLLESAMHLCTLYYQPIYWSILSFLRYHLGSRECLSMCISTVCGKEQGLVLSNKWINWRRTSIVTPSKARYEKMYGHVWWALSDRRWTADIRDGSILPCEKGRISS